jgi:hypothetical protein
VVNGDVGCEAYTAIAWGVGLSHERSYIAGAESSPGDAADEVRAYDQSEDCENSAA